VAACGADLSFSVVSVEFGRSPISSVLSDFAKDLERLEQNARSHSNGTIPYKPMKKAKATFPCVDFKCIPLGGERLARSEGEADEMEVNDVAIPAIPNP
jgi:hypothetical protein